MFRTHESITQRERKHRRKFSLGSDLIFSFLQKYKLRCRSSRKVRAASFVINARRQSFPPELNPSLFLRFSFVPNGALFYSMIRSIACIWFFLLFSYYVVGCSHGSKKNYLCVISIGKFLQCWFCWNYSWRSGMNFSGSYVCKWWMGLPKEFTCMRIV